MPTQNIIVIPLRGHIQDQEPVARFDSWTQSDPRELITDQNSIEKKPMQGSQVYIHILKEFGKNAAICVIGTDADVEGCNIGIKDALPFVQAVNQRVQVKQLWISSLQPRDVRRGFANLIPPKYSWAEAGESRAVIDALIGFSATREVTLTLRPILAKLGRKVASIGRVQTCLLYLIYKREEEIQHFVPTPYWTISARINLQGTPFSAAHENNPFKDPKEAERVYGIVREAEKALLTLLTTQSIDNRPPTPLNTTKALVLLTRHAGIPAAIALKTMEELYLAKLISYPRTDSDVYAADFDHSSNLQQFAQHSGYGAFIKQILATGSVVPTRGRTDAGDHIPITPMESAEMSDARLDSNIKKRVYDLLTRHYIALFFPPAKESKADLTFDIKGETFLAHNLECVSNGYLEVLPEFAPKYVKLPSIKQGQTYPVVDLQKEEKQTTPPPHYNDTTLIQLMEKKKIGTKSTRPAMIQILLDREYVERNKKQIHITPYGYSLMTNLEKIWGSFLDPNFTRHVEEQLDAVIAGTLPAPAAVNQIRAEFLQLFDAFRTNKVNFLGALQSMPNNSKAGSKSLGQKPKREQLSFANCPFCGASPMKVVKTQKGSQFLACTNENCKKTLALPKKGRITFLKTKCQICGFSPVEIKTSKNKHPFSYVICPHCWTRSFNIEEEKQGFCKNCQKGKIEDKLCLRR